MSTEKLFVSWSDIDLALKSLSNLLQANQFDFTSSHILGLQRGGLIPAVYLSHQLDIGMSVVAASYYNENNERDELVIDEIVLASEILNSKHFFIVDDIYDSGDTFRGTVAKLIDLGVEQQKIICCAILAKTISPKLSVPLIAGQRVSPDQWVVFPWELSE